MILLFFDIGGGEVLVLVLAVLLVFGPKQAGTIMRKTGKILSDLKKAGASARDEIMKEDENKQQIASQPLKEISNKIETIDSDYEMAEERKQQDIERDKKETERATTI